MRAAAGQGALDLEELEAGQGQVGPVLLEQRHDEQLGVTLQGADQDVARAGGRDQLVDRIGKAHAARGVALGPQHLGRGGGSQLHVD